MVRAAKGQRLGNGREAAQLVAMRGVRGGLLFTLSPTPPVAELLTALEARLARNDRSQGATRTLTAYVELCGRELSEEDERAIRHVFATAGNLIVGGFSGAPTTQESAVPAHVIKGTVRSGTVLEHDGDVIVIGDVNPGAQIVASGDIFVMGHLRGSAHAGATGNRNAVVAATYFQPLQVRIAQVVRRSPDHAQAPAEMEFAYLDGEQMAVQRMSSLPLHLGTRR
ncbi:MAG: septum site-determining protein MinC [Firmicutes bacterium]|nr:septum site-determining protein MinC [Bacillota bacterium]